MLLAIDIGNTNIEFGVYEQAGIRARFRLGTNREITSDEIGLFMMQFFSINGIDKAQIEDIIITTVVPQVMYSLSNAMKKYIGLTPLVIGENIRCEIENRYDNPKEVGADRLVNSLAAFERYGGPLIIVDFGTATTFDVVSKDGAYLGGSIYPGVKISVEALFEKTAKLPRVELVKRESAIGKNTIGSVQSGVMFGYVGAVLHIVAQIERELGEKARVIGTGGLANMIGEQQPGIFYAIDRTLTLDGLKLIYDRYQKNCKGK